jgi:hypothetical protein
MGLHIASNFMWSDDTKHTAREEGGTWTVTWLPGRVLDHSQAVTAMMIAEKASQGVGLSDDPLWRHLEGMAAELGLSAANAIARASERPEDTA